MEGGLLRKVKRFGAGTIMLTGLVTLYGSYAAVTTGYAVSDIIRNGKNSEDSAKFLDYYKKHTENFSIPTEFIMTSIAIGPILAHTANAISNFGDK